MDYHIIEIPVWLQHVLSAGAFWFLVFMDRMSSVQLQECGWVGHQSSDDVD